MAATRFSLPFCSQNCPICKRSSWEQYPACQSWCLEMGLTISSKNIRQKFQYWWGNTVFGSTRNKYLLLFGVDQNSLENSHLGERSNIKKFPVEDSLSSINLNLDSLAELTSLPETQNMLVLKDIIWLNFSPSCLYECKREANPSTGGLHNNWPFQKCARFLVCALHWTLPGEAVVVRMSGQTALDHA